MRTRAIQPKWRKLVTPSTPATDYQAVAAAGGRTYSRTKGDTKGDTRALGDASAERPRKRQEYWQTVKHLREAVKFFCKAVKIFSQAVKFLPYVVKHF